MAETPLKMVALTELKPSPLNPRKHFDPVALRELADSIAGVGVLQPIVARPKGKAYEIVFGERRWRAATLAGVATVPVLEREMTDEQVLRVQLIENKQRADTTPLEEGRGYKQLMAFDPKKYTAASIAEMVGVSEKYVWDRMKLTELIPEAQSLLDEGRIGAAHGILIARLTPKQQKAVIHPDTGGLFQGLDSRAPDAGEPLLSLGEGVGAEVKEEDKRSLGRQLGGERLDDYKAASVRELDGWISRHFRFDPAQAAAAAPLLFAETKAAVDQALARPGRRKKVVQITFDHMAPDAIRHDGGERVYGRTSWKKSSFDKDGNGECPSTALGVVSAGTQAHGRTLPVCVDRDCKVHFKREISERNAMRRARGAPPKPAGGGNAGPSEAEKKKWEAARLAQETRERKEREDREAFKRIAPAMMKAVVKSVQQAPMKTIVPLAARYMDDAIGAGDAYHHLGFKECRSAEDVVRVLVMDDIVNATEYEANDVKSFCKAVGPFGGGLPAVLKHLQARAEPKKPKKPAAKKTGAKKTPAKKAAKRK